jgi:hypothetical protein
VIQGRAGFPSAGTLRQLMVALTTVCLVASGCTTVRTVPLNPPPDPAHRDVATGRGVTVLLPDGTQVRAEVLTADAGGLTVRAGAFGQPRYLAFSDMESLHVHDRATGRTVAAVVGGTLLVATAVLYYLLVQYHKNDD